MRRRLVAVAAVAVLLLTGCTERYDSPDDRSHAVGDAVAEKLRDIEPPVGDVDARGSFDGITVEARLDDRSAAETRAFIEAALPVVAESPLGAMPIRMILQHDAAAGSGSGPGSGTLEWQGYDPARAERYYAAVELWLEVLADPGVKVKEKFEVRAAAVYGAIEVLDGRDPGAYRAELDAALAQAGYVDPPLTVTSAPASGAVPSGT